MSPISKMIPARKKFTLRGKTAFLFAFATLWLGLPANAATGGGNTETDRLPAINVINTYSAMNRNIGQLGGVLNQKTLVLFDQLEADCAVFGANGVCLTLGGRHYAENRDSGTGQYAVSAQMAFRMNRAAHMGISLDQPGDSESPDGMDVANDVPLMGVFAVFGGEEGMRLRLAGSYGTSNMTITRPTLTGTEPGQGSTDLTSIGVLAELGYMFDFGNGASMLPYAGLRQTAVTRKGYTEKANASVSYPINYQDMAQKQTTLVAGLKMNTKAGSFGFGLGGGAEYDFDCNVEDYKGSITGSGSFALGMPSVVRARAFADASASYYFTDRSIFTVGAALKRQTFDFTNAFTVRALYTIGF